MKWVIYIMVLANLGFGLLHYRSVVLTSAQAPTEDDTLRLVLLKEYLAEQESSGQTTETTETAEARCNTLGPFKKKKSANAIRKKLDELGITAVRRVNKDKKRKGFWVMIPPAQKRADARQSIKELKAKGVNDYFLVVTGEQTNAVSLGVFSRSELAQRRYDEIKKQGFKVRIRPVDLPVREYWLDWSLDQQLLPEVLEAFREKHSGIGQTERRCPEVGTE